MIRPVAGRSIDAPGPWAVVGVSLAALAAGTFCTVAIGALAPELQADLGLSRGEIGLLTGLVSAGASIASRRAGALTDTAGPATVLAGALLLFTIAFAGAAAAPSAALLMAALFVAGLGYGGTNPPTNVVIAGRMTARIGFFMSLKQTGVPIGGFLAGIVLPPIAVASSWRVAFGVGALVSLSVAGATRFLRGAAVLSAPAEGAHLHGPSRRERWVIGVYGLVMAGTQWVFLTYLVLYLTERRGFGLERAGLVLAAATACSVGGRLVWGWLSDRSGRRVEVLLATSAVAAAALAVFAAGVSGPAVWPVAILAGTTLVGWNGVFHALVADRAGPGRIGRLSGEVMAFVFAGSTIAPPVLGLVSDQSDSWTLLWALAAALVVGAGVLLRAGIRP
jgi:MFS family permease